MVYYPPLKLSVTEDDLTADTGLTFFCGIGILFTPQQIIMKLHYIDEKKIIS